MHQRLLYTESDNSRLIYASLSTIEKTFKPVSHSHPNTEIIYVSEGEGYIVCLNEKIKLYKGDLAVITGGVEHREEGVLNKPFTFYAIGVNNFEIANSVIGINKFTPFQNDLEGFAVSFKNVFEELKRDDGNRKNVIDLYTELIFTLTLRYVDASLSVSEKHGTSLVESTKRFIDSRFYTQIKIDELATSLSVSYSTLIHTFKAETGKTIIEYKLLRQIDEAKSLLSLTDMSINQIALYVGFGTNTYFSKILNENLALPLKNIEKYKNTNNIG